MDVSYVTAFAALGGAALGGCTSFVTSWTNLHLQMKAQQTANSKSIRQHLYKKFIDKASIIYGDALIHNTLELSGLIGLYALLRGCAFFRHKSNRKRVESCSCHGHHEQPNKTPKI